MNKWICFLLLFTISICYTHEKTSYQIIDYYWAQQNFKEVKHLGEKFLQAYPNSEYRYEIISMLKKIEQKNIQIYGVNTIFFEPQKPLSFFMVALNVPEIHFEIKHIPLETLLQEKRNLHILPHTAKTIQTWIEKNVAKEHMFCKVIQIKPLPQGCYFLVARYQNIISDLGFFVTDLGLVTKQSENKLLLWTSLLNGQKNVNPTEIYIFHNQQIIQKAQTNQQGIFTTTLQKDQTPITILAHSNGNIAITDMHYFYYHGLQKRCYIYLNKEEYLPNETVQAHILAWQIDSVTKGLFVPQNKIYLSIQDETWHNVYRKEITLDAWGHSLIHFKIPHNMKFGRYCFRVYGATLGEKYFHILEKTKKVEKKDGNLKTNTIEYIENQQSLSLPSGWKNRYILATYETNNLENFQVLKDVEKIEILKLKTFLPKIQLSLHQFHNRELIQNTLPIFLGEKVIFQPKRLWNYKDIFSEFQQYTQNPHIQFPAYSMPQDYFLNALPNLIEFFCEHFKNNISTIDSLQFEFQSDLEHRCWFSKTIK